MTTVHPTAIIASGAVLGEEAVVGPYCVIGPNVRLGEGTELMSHVVVDGWTMIGKKCRVFPFASLGTQTQDLKYKGGRTFVEIGDGTTIREYVTINGGTNEGEVNRVGSGCLIMAYCHIAHTCAVGNGVIMANGASLSGHVLVEDQAILGGLCGVHQFVRIGRMAIIGGMSKVTQDCPPFMMIDGNPAVARGLNQVALKRRNVPEETRELLKRAYRLLYREGLTTRNALTRIRAELPGVEEIESLVAFVEGSERGIVRSFGERARKDGAAPQEDKEE